MLCEEQQQAAIIQLRTATSGSSDPAEICANGNRCVRINIQFFQRFLRIDPDELLSFIVQDNYPMIHFGDEIYKDKMSRLPELFVVDTFLPTQIFDVANIKPRFFLGFASRGIDS